ncbi:hypothetical protein ISP15_17875 [Dyella jejuensis]|uniref:Uncharacterized protein n=1 Tax=Dyella jejuensis TaxID=1432009 RepID=A0ABW8JPM1_9GAMM
MITANKAREKKPCLGYLKNREAKFISSYEVAMLKPRVYLWIIPPWGASDLLGIYAAMYVFATFNESILDHVISGWDGSADRLGARKPLFFDFSIARCAHPTQAG